MSTSKCNYWNITFLLTYTGPLGYDSEICAMKVEDIARLERTERIVARWMCGFT